MIPLPTIENERNAMEKYKITIRSENASGESTSPNCIVSCPTLQAAHKLFKNTLETDVGRGGKVTITVEQTKGRT